MALGLLGLATPQFLNCLQIVPPNSIVAGSNPLLYRLATPQVVSPPMEILLCGREPGSRKRGILMIGLEGVKSRR